MPNPVQSEVLQQLVAALVAGDDARRHVQRAHHDDEGDREVLAETELAVEPEFLARFGRDRDETFAMPQIGETHDFRGGFAHGAFIVAQALERAGRPRRSIRASTETNGRSSVS